MSKDIIFGILRHLLTAGGGVLVAKGYADPAGAEAIIGGVIALAGVVWSISSKKKPA